MRDAFLDGMSRAATTVSVITTDGPAGRAGLTVSAMCPVSADTPTPALLACVHHSAVAAEAILENGVFCINVLRAEQAVVADTFAGRIRTESGDKFDCATWRTLETGAPAMQDALASFDCRLTMHLRYGTHFVFFGELDGVALPAAGPPLVYKNRAYDPPVAAASTRFAPTGDAAGLTIAILPELAGMMPGLIAGFLATRPGIGIEIVEGRQAELNEALTLGTADLALTYDVGLGDAVERVVFSAAAPLVLLPAGDRRAGKRLLPADLAGAPLILDDSAAAGDLVLAGFAAAGVAPRVAWRASSPAMAAGLVAEGLGCAILLAAASPGGAPAAPGCEVARLATASPVNLVVAHSRGAPLTPLARAFLDLCLARLGAP